MHCDAQAGSASQPVTTAVTVPRTADAICQRAHASHHHSSTLSAVPQQAAHNFEACSISVHSGIGSAPSKTEWLDTEDGVSRVSKPCSVEDESCKQYVVTSSSHPTWQAGREPTLAPGSDIVVLGCICHIGSVDLFHAGAGAAGVVVESPGCRWDVCAGGIAISRWCKGGHGRR